MDDPEKMKTWIQDSTSKTCLESYHAFELTVSEETRFQAALTSLLPILNGHSHLSESGDILQQHCAERILSAYIVYAIYAPHPVSLNPFRSVIEEAYTGLHNFLNDGESSSKLALYNLARCLRVILTDRGYLLENTSPIELTRLEEGRFGAFDYSDVHTSDAQENPALQQQQDAAGPSSLVENDRSHPHVTYPSAQALALVDEAWTTILLSAKSRVLSLAEQKTLIDGLVDISPSTLRYLFPANLLPALSYLNGRITTTIVLRILQLAFDFDPITPDDPRLPYLTALRTLPPIFTSFDCLGSLLANSHQYFLGDSSTSGMRVDSQSYRLYQLVRFDIVNPFISNSLQEIEQKERYEAEEMISDEQSSRAVQLLCKFVISTIRSDAALAFLHVVSDMSAFGEGLDIELTNFALQHSRLAEANALYRSLASRYIVVDPNK